MAEGREEFHWIFHAIPSVMFNYSPIIFEEALNVDTICYGLPSQAASAAKCRPAALVLVEHKINKDYQHGCLPEGLTTKMAEDADG